MTIKQKLLGGGLLAFAGLLAAYVSFSGVSALLLSGFPQSRIPVAGIAFFAAQILALPLFLLAATNPKLGLGALWILAPWEWISLFVLAVPDALDDRFEFLGLVAACFLIRTPTLVLLASAVQLAQWIHRRPFKDSPI